MAQEVKSGCKTVLKKRRQAGQDGPDKSSGGPEVDCSNLTNIYGIFERTAQIID